MGADLKITTRNVRHTYVASSRKPEQEALDSTEPLGTAFCCILENAIALTQQVFEFRTFKRNGSCRGGGG